MKHVLRKIKDGKLNEWKSWCYYLVDNEVLAKETMKQENCTRERVVVFNRENEWYVVGSSEHSGEIIEADLSKEINVTHRAKISECLSKTVAVFYGEFKLPPEHEVLYDFMIL